MTRGQTIYNMIIFLFINLNASGKLGSLFYQSLYPRIITLCDINHIRWYKVHIKDVSQSLYTKAKGKFKEPMAFFWILNTWFVFCFNADGKSLLIMTLCLWHFSLWYEFLSFRILYCMPLLVFITFNKFTFTMKTLFRDTSKLFKTTIWY